MAFDLSRRFALSLALLAGLLAGLPAVAACGSSAAGDAVSTPDTGGGGACAVAPTFTSIYTQLLATRTCATSGCHATPGQSGLSLNGSADEVYTALVGAPSLGSLLERVKPMSPTDSFLYLKLSEAMPPSGLRMPQTGQALPACEIDAVQAWIAAGAPKN